MSRNPAIARTWFDKFHSDVYPQDYVVARGKKSNVPKYYDKVLESIDPESLWDIKQTRIEHFKERGGEDLTPERLAIREKKKKLEIQNLIRDL